MTDYYDGPRKGLANFMGRPHLYESQWKDIDTEDPDVFFLTPISPHVVAAALEDWQIWLRWERAHHLGETNQDTHPALAEDRQRHQELASERTSRLVTDPTCAVAANGEFRVPETNTKKFGWRELEVRWQPVVVGGD
jgi:hypothetical protein